MRPSLNEIESMGKRAARGAGLTWGLAEEAGKAARWLAAHGLPGVEALAALLARNDGAAYADLAPLCLAGGWRPRANAICPLIAGAALTDRAVALKGGTGLTLHAVACPVLLVPALAGVVAATGLTLALNWEGAEMIVSPDAAWTGGERAAHIRAAPADIRIRPAQAGTGAPLTAGQRPEVADDVWTRLSALAQRTFAPATEASRRAGAGAGLSDND